MSSVARRQTDTKVKHKNDPENVIFQNFDKQKMRFIFMSQGTFILKIRFLGQKVCSVARSQTDTKAKTEDTLSGFQDFVQTFLQPIIMERSNYMMIFLIILLFENT